MHGSNVATFQPAPVVETAREWLNDKRRSRRHRRLSTVARVKCIRAEKISKCLRRRAACIIQSDPGDCYKRPNVCAYTYMHEYRPDTNTTGIAVLGRRAVQCVRCCLPSFRPSVRSRSGLLWTTRNVLPKEFYVQTIDTCLDAFARPLFANAWRDWHNPIARVIMARVRRRHWPSVDTSSLLMRSVAEPRRLRSTFFRAYETTVTAGRNVRNDAAGFRFGTARVWRKWRRADLWADDDVLRGRSTPLRVYPVPSAICEECGALSDERIPTVRETTAVKGSYFSKGRNDQVTRDLSYHTHRFEITANFY